MKFRIPWHAALLLGSALFAGAAWAQVAPAAATSATASVTLDTAQGIVVINSVPAPAPTIAPAPEFDQLAAGGTSITAEQASAYTPLANDFLNADNNKDRKISAAEYARWVKQLR